MHEVDHTFITFQYFTRHCNNKNYKFVQFVDIVASWLGITSILCTVGTCKHTISTLFNVSTMLVRTLVVLQILILFLCYGYCSFKSSSAKLEELLSKRFGGNKRSMQCQCGEGEEGKMESRRHNQGGSDEEERDWHSSTRGSRMAYAQSNCLYSNHYSSHANHTWDKLLV